VDTNRQRALTALFEKSFLRDSELKLAHIVHSFQANILHAKTAGEYKAFDASLTTTSNIVLSQTTADCGTVIIASKGGEIVALVHGSWHTLSARIICKVVAKMKTHTSNELIAGIGPMICANCYEFGDEAVDLFLGKYLSRPDGKYRVNLRQMIIDQLRESGVSQIDDVSICTLEDERFFSHRRSGAHSGRFLTLASPR
jgi:hypothetical protein